MSKNSFYGRGKLLITGDYAVVRGAKALAIPTGKGQKLSVSTGRGSDIKWKSFDADGQVWFDAKISLFDFSPLKTNDEEVARRLATILEAAVRLNSDFLSTWKGVKVETALEFPRFWGWGSSSTLIYCIAQWADVDPYDLYASTFGGSGYDIACAGSDLPVLFSKVSSELVDLRPAAINEKITPNLFFIYSGKKAGTSDALSYIKQNEMDPNWIDEVSEISQCLSETASVSTWIKGIDAHNKLLEKYLGSPGPESEFSDFNGAIKSLGARGGDFYMAVSKEGPKYVKSYFGEKGLNEILDYDEVAASPSGVEV